jgi:predicted transcriptional regulator
LAASHVLLFIDVSSALVQAHGDVQWKDTAAKAKSNLSRTLRMMENYGLVHLERHERGRVVPTVMPDRVVLDTWHAPAPRRRKTA